MSGAKILEGPLELVGLLYRPSKVSAETPPLVVVYPGLLPLTAPAAVVTGFQELVSMNR